ncbi:MAG: calcium-binding protein, partial [Tepidisphaeraceae bacterium]
MRRKLHHHRRVLSNLAPQAEALESRRLLAGIEAGVLVARGTSGGDTISVRRSATDDVIVTTNGVSQAFDMDDFTGVRLEGLGGNDTFNLIDPLTSPVVRNTTVLGGAGNDTISYASRSAALDFTIDPDGSSMASGPQIDEFDDVETVIGGSGADVLGYGNVDGPPADDQPTYSFRLEGRGGDDRFDDGLSDGHNFGTVTLLGGDGNDRFGDDEYGSELFFGEAGDDLVSLKNHAYSFDYDGGTGTDTVEFIGPSIREVSDLRDFIDFENAKASGGSQPVIGTDGPNLIDARGVNGIRVYGLDGDDTVLGGIGDNLIEGGEGNDSLSDGEHNDTLDGGPGIDTLDGGPGDDVLLNGEVNDRRFGITNFTLFGDGTDGNDVFTLVRSSFDNVVLTINGIANSFDMDDFNTVRLFGSGGDDQITIGDGIHNVIMHGDAGNDRLTDGNGNNFLYGDGGDDTLVSGLGNDFLLGGTGRDTADFTARTANLVIDQNDSGNADGQAGENDHVSSDIERVLGGSGNDRFIGNAGNNTYFGGGGNDSMDGGGGDDALFGEG